MSLRQSETENIRFEWVMWSSILSFERRLRNLKVTLVRRSIAKKLELILSRNKSEKGIAKKVSITIMRFPRWHIDCHLQVRSAACWMIVWRLTSSHLFLAIARRPSTSVSQVNVGAWLFVSCARQSRRSPSGIFAKKINPKSVSLPEELSAGRRCSVVRLRIAS